MSENSTKRDFCSHYWLQRIAPTLGASCVLNKGQFLLRFGLPGLSIYYPVFPSGLSEFDKKSAEKLLLDNKQLLNGFSLIRFCLAQEPSQILGLGSLNFRAQETIITKISDLAVWDQKELPASLKRNFKKAIKMNVYLRSATSEDASDVFNLYSAAVMRNGGSLRYTKRYFSELLQGGAENINCTIAYLNEVCVAMNISAIHEGEAFYLHGGFNERYGDLRSSDLLMLEAIKWAKASGAQSFDFMSSPAGQMGLIQYKEKWGGESRVQYTVDAYRNRFAMYFLDLAIKLHGFAKKVLK